MDGLYIDFKAKHMELFIQLGIRKKTFLIMLIEEFSLCALAGVLIGGSLGLLITRAFTSIGWALLLYTGLIILAMAFHQEKILRLIQFRPREQTKPDRPNYRWTPLFLLIGLLALIITFWWFHRRKSAETLLVISTLIIALWGLFLGIGGFYVKRRREKITLMLSRNDLFYRFHKSINVLMLVSLLQVLITGIFLPRVVTFQQTAVDNLFPYDVVGQHIGVSETTYQQLRQANDLEKQPLHLKKGQWHVVYQQAISIRGQPIDWDPQSVRPRLRIGTPLESYNTANVDVIFPMRTIKSQERLILTGMFQRGLQENILVVADEEFATLSKKDQPNQLFLIHGDKKIAHALNFLNQKYVDDKRWDDTIEPVYEKTQRKSNVVSENYLQVLLLIFTIVICIFMSVGLIVAKFESEETRLIERRRLLDQLGMRQKEQRSVLKRQVGFFTVLPLAVGFLLSLGFIGIMGRLRFFSMSEWLQFGGIFLLDFGIYLFVWGTIASLIYRRIEKWR